MMNAPAATAHGPTLTPRSNLGHATQPEPTVPFFHAAKYQRMNLRRMEHLATLGLPLRGRRVLEVGAGIGDLTTFFVDRGCTVVTTEGRAGHVALLRERFAGVGCVTAHQLDLDPAPPDGAPGWDTGPRGVDHFDVVFCYGLIYHLSDPRSALDFLRRRLAPGGDGLLLIETMVSMEPGDLLVPCVENAMRPGAAVSGMGCYPTRGWLWRELSSRFAHVYSTVNQPAHEEFPTDWRRPLDAAARSVFVASDRPVPSTALTACLPDVQPAI